MTETANQIEGLQSIDHYENELKNILPLEFPNYSNTKLDELHKNALVSAENEDIRSLIPDIISVFIDSSLDTLSELSRKIMNKLTELNSNFLFGSDEIATIIHKISKRKNYGKKSKNLYEDRESVYLLCWELFEYKQPLFIIRERTLIGAVVKTLDKLINEMNKEIPKSLFELFANYNKACFAYKKFKEEQNEGKRKKQDKYEVKEKKEQERKAKIEEEKKRKNEELLKKKEEDKRKKELEKKRIEDERKRVEEEKKKAKEDKKREEELKRKEIEMKKESEKKKVESVNIASFFQKNSSKPEEKIIVPELNTKIPPSISRQNIFIFFADSHLKPYYSGKIEPALINPGVKSMFTKFDTIDYNIDSEEEYEENNGEDIHSGDSAEEEDEDDLSQSELEKLNEFVVADGHLSAEEKEPNDEIKDTDNQENAENLVNQEIANNYLWMNTELKEMTILENDDLLLESCRAISISNELIPIKIPEKPIKVVKEPKPPKMVITDIIEKEILIIAQGKQNLEEIIKAVKEKYSLVSKAAVKNLIKEKMIKRKDGLRNYVLKDIVEGS